MLSNARDVGREAIRVWYEILTVSLRGLTGAHRCPALAWGTVKRVRESCLSSARLVRHERTDRAQTTWESHGQTLWAPQCPAPFSVRRGSSCRRATRRLVQRAAPERTPVRESLGFDDKAKLPSS